MNNLPQVAEKQVLRGLVLKTVEAAEPLGAGTEVVLSSVRQYGYSVNKDDISECFRYLEGKELVRVETVKNEVLKISRDIAHVTPKGIDVLEGTETVSGIELID